jgi:hypothetical protein
LLKVAQTGLEPATSDYEPDMIPFHYRAKINVSQARRPVKSARWVLNPLVPGTLSTAYKAEGIRAYRGRMTSRTPWCYPRFAFKATPGPAWLIFHGAQYRSRTDLQRVAAVVPHWKEPRMPATHNTPSLAQPPGQTASLMPRRSGELRARFPRAMPAHSLAKRTSAPAG